MLFDTPIYFVFLTIVVVCYWRLQRRSQNYLLLGASYLFYGWWDWRFLGLILLSTLVDYFCAHVIDQSDSPARRRTALWVSIVLNLGFLGFFKYCNFFIDSFAGLMDTLGIPVSDTTLQILLPPGISFYTFQAVAYIVDVYHRRIKPADSLVDYALFISLFPHLIAGPIQRPSHLLPQVQAVRVFNTERFYDGLQLIAMGLFRKVVIADNCALLADAAFSGRLGEPNLAVLAIGAYAFAWQIYGDFSGYSDIARGSAQLLGFHFMVNFRQPYLATSLQDFWRRWHISLSTWLRDYLYIPLGGSRYGEARTYRNLMLTMLLGGLWHGANWTFVIWGGIQGVGLSIERFVRRVLGREVQATEGQTEPNSGLVSIWFNRILIFHLVCLSWIFFRSASVADAFAMLSGIGRIEWIPEYGTAFTFLAAFAIPMFLLDLVNERRGEEYLFARLSPTTRAAVAMSLVLVAVMFAGSSVNAFIYFQF
jgi:D-alanyl-lipoteichoic acid acyltransferase DltB (MBOAT superfamily)